jgi:hypothetical protein
VYGFEDADLVAGLKEPIYYEEKFDNFNLPDHDLPKLMEYACAHITQDYASYGILIKTGRMADCHGMKVFSPYLDKRVSHFIMHLDHPLRTKIQHGTSTEYINKYIHRELARQFFPPSFINRPKQGGAIDPYVHLQDGARVKAIKERLKRSDIINKYFKIDLVDNLFTDMRSNATRILILLALDLWNNIFQKSLSFEKPKYDLKEYLGSNI